MKERFDQLEKMILELRDLINDSNSLKSKISNPATSRYLPHSEAAKYLGISTSTLYTKVSKRIIPNYSSSKKSNNIYLVSDLEKYIKANKRRTMSEIREGVNRRGVG